MASGLGQKHKRCCRPSPIAWSAKPLSFSAHEVMLPLGSGAPSLARLFLQAFKLSATSWGGFALMSAARSVFVERDRTVTDEAFADAVALAWLMPGPVAVNVAIRLGAVMRGARGALVMGMA